MAPPTDPSRLAIVAVALCGAAAFAQPITPSAKLLPTDGAADDEFGLAVAIDQGLVVVGSPYDDDLGPSSGSAYLFDASTGAQLRKLLPSDGAAGDFFGWSVAIHNNLVVVGAYLHDANALDTGAAYVFDATTGAQLHKLLPTDLAPGDELGWSVAIHNAVAAVGSHHDDDLGANSGSAYLFDATTGAQLHKLLPDDGAPDDRFGRSIDIFETTVAVGALFNDDLGDESGSAYLFDTTTGAQLHKLLPDDGGTRDRFGWDLAIDRGLLVVGAPYDAGASGSAYVLDAATGAQLAKVVPTDVASGDRFARAVALDQGLAVAGSWGDDDNGPASGSAYVVNARCFATADLNADGVLDNADLTTFVALFLAADPAADTNNDGFLDNADIAAFIQLFLNAC